MHTRNAPGARDLLGAVLVLESLATFGMALWLVWVTIMVLPARDPGHITMWGVAAFGFFCYCGLSWMAVAMGSRIPPVRWALLLVSMAALALGVYGIANMLRQPGGHFEGYIVLMGLILGVHGATGIAYSVIAGRSSGLADRLAGHARTPNIA